jgi:POT family proton-dependent oligopeptide transporter
MINQQPKALYLLFFVKMWECFSFYGMRALMILYLINELGVRDARAYGIYAIYCSLFEFSGIVGGRFADRLLGLRKSIAIGGWVIALGHIFLSLQTDNWGFFGGLAMIIVGSGLFSTNISALLGLFYEENDPRREAGFTWFYVGINVGALLATLLCGLIGETYGWHYGFGLAAIGMIVGNILFQCCANVLEGKGELVGVPPTTKVLTIGYILLGLAWPLCAIMIAWEDLFLQIMPIFSLVCILAIGRKMWLSTYFPKEKLIYLGLYLMALTLFFAAEDQTASLFLVFSDRLATGSIAGFQMPTTTLLSLNPFVIIIGGTLLSKLKIAGKNSVVIGLSLAGAVFAMMASACFFPNQEGNVPSFLVAVSIIVLSIGEVFLAPAIFSFCSEIAPKEWQGVTMGLIPLGFSLGNSVSGFLSKSMDVGDLPAMEALEIYGFGFSRISLMLGLMAMIILCGQPIVYKYFNKEVVS